MFFLPFFFLSFFLSFFAESVFPLVRKCKTSVYHISSCAYSKHVLDQLTATEFSQGEKIRSGGHDWGNFCSLTTDTKYNDVRYTEILPLLEQDSVARRHLANTQYQRFTQPTILPVGMWRQTVHIFYWPCWWLRSLRSVLSIALWPRVSAFASY
jgi:hypothetical protein